MAEETETPFGDDGDIEEAAKPVRRSYWGMQPDGDFGIEIVFDEDDIEDCKEVAFVLYGVIHGHYGAAVANKIFSERVMTAQQIKKEKNDRLLMTALRRLIDSRSVEQVAADLAEENKTQWRVGGSVSRSSRGQDSIDDGYAYSPTVEEKQKQPGYSAMA